MVNDSISDTLIRIKNAYQAGLGRVVLPWSKVVEQLVLILKKQKYLQNVQVKEELGRKSVIVELLYTDKSAAFTQVKRISKPSRRVYVGANKIPSVLGGSGLAVISTPKGVMTDKEARKAHLGGEVWCKIW